MEYRRLQVCEPLSRGASSGEEDSDGAGGGFGASTSSSDDLSGEDSDMSGEDEQLCCPERVSHIFRDHSDRRKGGIPASNLTEALQELRLKPDTEIGTRADRDSNAVIDWEEFQDCINHLLVEEATAKAASAKAQIERVRKEILEGKDGDSLRQAAAQLHKCWRGITVHKFLRWFQAMEQDPCAQEDRVQMLNSLMLTVPENYFKASGRETQAPSRTGIMENTSFGKLHGDIMKGDSVVVEFSSQKLPVGPAANDDGKLAVDFQRKRSGVDIENSLLGNVKEKYLLAYFTLPLLWKEHIHDVVREIERASVDSNIFATPIVSAILTEGWHTTQPVFYGVLVLDFSVIVCLSISATDARNQKIPSRCCILVLFFISSVFFVNELCIAIRRIPSRWRQSKPFFDSFWSFYEMMVTVYFFAIMVAGLYCKRDLVRSARALTPKQESWLYNHAIWVEFLVFLKTTHFSIKLLCVRALGERVIPAYCALTHKSSLGLLVFLFVLYCNACLTFHAVPVNIYAPDEADRQPWDYWENWFDLFILQFRLAFLGESEPDELEGSNKRVLFNVTGNKWEGDILDPSTHTRYHHGVQVTNVLFLIFIHILVLNVYIGVLSQQYNNFVRREREHFEKFRAFFIGKQIYWSRHCPRCRRRGEGADATWIAYKRSVFRDPFDEDGRTQQERAQELQKFSDRLDLAAEDRAELLRILQATAPPKAK